MNDRNKKQRPGRDLSAVELEWNDEESPHQEESDELDDSAIELSHIPDRDQEFHLRRQSNPAPIDRSLPYREKNIGGSMEAEMAGRLDVDEGQGYIGDPPSELSGASKAERILDGDRTIEPLVTSAPRRGEHFDPDYEDPLLKEPLKKLQHMADSLNIPGRQEMTQRQLVRAIREQMGK